MRAWHTTEKDTWCAFCGDELQVGTRVLLVQLPEVMRQRSYCETCALTRFFERPLAQAGQEA